MVFVILKNYELNFSQFFTINIQDKLRLSWAKLKLSLVRAIDEVTLIFNSVEVEIEDIVELSLLVLVGGSVGGEKNEINAILNSVVV